MIPKIFRQTIDGEVTLWGEIDGKFIPPSDPDVPSDKFTGYYTGDGLMVFQNDKISAVKGRNRFNMDYYETDEKIPKVGTVLIGKVVEVDRHLENPMFNWALDSTEYPFSTPLDLLTDLTRISKPE